MYSYVKLINPYHYTAVGDATLFGNLWKKVSLKKTWSILRSLHVSIISDPGFNADRIRIQHFKSMRIWIQHFRSMRIRILIQGFDNQKIKKIYSWKKLNFFDQKLQFTYTWASMSGRGREGLIYTVMERFIPPDFVWVAQLRVSDNSSYWYIVNVHNTLPPAGVSTLVDSCSFSVSTMFGYGQTKS